MTNFFEPREVGVIKTRSFFAFSSDLSKCNTIEEVESCIGEHFKFFIDYETVRARFSISFEPYCFCVSRSKVKSTDCFSKELQFYEKEVIKTKTPRVFNSEEFALISEEKIPLTDLNVWVWNFSFGNNYIILSLAAKADKSFDFNSISMLRMFTEMLATKLNSISLMEQLQHTVENQNKVIFDTTRKLRSQNESLLDLLKYNSHAIREPLTRILSIVDFVGDDKAKLLSMFDFLNKSARDLDDATKFINVKLENEIMIE